jgi:hypothetical protein
MEALQQYRGEIVLREDFIKSFGTPLLACHSPILSFISLMCRNH